MSGLDHGSPARVYGSLCGRGANTSTASEALQLQRACLAASRVTHSAGAPGAAPDAAASAPVLLDAGGTAAAWNTSSSTSVASESRRSGRALHAARWTCADQSRNGGWHAACDCGDLSGHGGLSEFAAVHVAVVNARGYDCETARKGLMHARCAASGRRLARRAEGRLAKCRHVEVWRGRWGRAVQKTVHCHTGRSRRGGVSADGGICTRRVIVEQPCLVVAFEASLQLWQWLVLGDMTAKQDQLQAGHGVPLRWRRAPTVCFWAGGRKW